MITQNNGSYIWKVPYNIPNSNDYSIYILTTDNSCSDDSGLFTITGIRRNNDLPYYIFILLVLISVISITIVYKIFKLRR